MAEHGAHLTSGGAGSPDTPSIFEVLAQENLLSAVRPAIKHVFRVLAEKNPARFAFLYHYGDEVYAILDLVLQNHYLKRYNASFAENFYGLKRVTINKEDEQMPRSADSPRIPQLPSRTLKKSLLFLVILPYIRLKLDNLYEEMKATQISYNSNSKSLRNILCKAFLGIYPYVHMTLEGAAFLFQLRYLLKMSEFHSPWLKLAGVKLTSLTENDIRLQLNQDNKRLVLSSDSWWRQIQFWLSRGVGGLAILLSNGLSVSVFFLQFLDWWYSSDSPAVSLTALPIPDPPKKFDCMGDGSVPNIMCPLCKTARTNDTALSVSGYVFCYPCIFRYLNQYGCCPVTGYPATSNHLIRIYSQDS